MKTANKETGRYYLVNYDSRLGGDYCEIYDENLIRIDIIKGSNKIEGLTQIGRKNSSTSYLYDIEPLNDKFVILKNRDDEAVIVAAEAFRGDK